MDVSAHVLSSPLNETLGEWTKLWKNAADSRDPNPAWNSDAKIHFLIVYIAVLITLSATVYCWNWASEAFACCRRWSLTQREPVFCYPGACTNTEEMSSLRTARYLLVGDWLSESFVPVVPGPEDEYVDEDPEANPIRSLVEMSGKIQVHHEDDNEVNVGPTPLYPDDQCAHELFEEYARISPSATALIIPSVPEVPGMIVTERLEVTYQGLNELVQRLTEVLLSVGVVQGHIVALILERSITQVVATYGTLRAGAAFLPMDPEAPLSRKHDVLSGCEVRALIIAEGDHGSHSFAREVAVPYVQMGFYGRIQQLCAYPESSASIPAWKRPKPSDMAMLIFTSGTSGKPKGIIYDHQHLQHGSYFFGKACNISANSITLLKSPYFWAVIEWEMFPALTNGGRLVIAEPMGHKNPKYIVRLIQEERVNILMITPGVLDLMLDVVEGRHNDEPLHSLKHVISVGAPLPSVLANRFVAMSSVQSKLLNFYGASESCCTVYPVPAKGIDLQFFPQNAPVGFPQPHAKVYVMCEDDGSLVPVEPGETGEICFGGVLAAGYYKLDELTKQKFVETETFGRLYRTGDMGRWRAGAYEILGRIDRQVKVRGVRVEPEEIEAVLRTFSIDEPTYHDLLPGSKHKFALSSFEKGVGVLNHVAVVASDEPVELVAFVDVRDGVATKRVTNDMLKRHCQRNLNSGYVPNYFVIVEDNFPVLPNGKPDLSQLAIRATQVVNAEDEIVLDSMGMLRKQSKAVREEMKVAYRCYSYWMLGVLIDHYTACAAPTKLDGHWALYPYCGVLGRRSVQPWAELILRSIGNDQDMIGFILIGAYQESNASRVEFGRKDAVIFLLYLAMALPIPQLFAYIIWPLGYDLMWPRTDWWGLAYMTWDSQQGVCGHRWYMLFLFLSHAYLAICSKMRVPAVWQTFLIWMSCLFFREYWAPTIPDSSPVLVRYLFWWFVAGYDSSVQIYIAIHVTAYHYSRRLVTLLSPRLPKGPVVGAAATSLSFIMGVFMAMFHYPNFALESGIVYPLHVCSLEIVAGCVQTGLLILGMSNCSFDLTWCGGASLCTFVVHYYIKDEVRIHIGHTIFRLRHDSSSILIFVYVLSLCIFVLTCVGPAINFLLSIPLRAASGRARR